MTNTLDFQIFEDKENPRCRRVSRRNRGPSVKVKREKRERVTWRVDDQGSGSCRTEGPSVWEL